MPSIEIIENTLLKLLVRRGTNADRLNTVLTEGELGYTTDSKRLFVGDNQTFGGNELYSSLDEKAAHLLYFIIKDHPFSDGNKRIGSFVFIYFLKLNGILLRSNGEAKINDNTLVALALLIAESNPKDKELMVALTTNLLA